MHKLVKTLKNGQNKQLNLMACRKMMSLGIYHKNIEIRHRQGAIQ